MGEMRRTFQRGTQILIGEFAGDLFSRLGTKFGLGTMLTNMRVPPQMVQPITRIAIGLLAPPLLKMLPGRFFNSDFRSTFAAVNVASGLIGLTANLRQQAFAAVGLSDYDTGLYDWETADDEIGDWETADDGIGGYELADAPPHGVLGEAPPPGILDYDVGVMAGY